MKDLTAVPPSFVSSLPQTLTTTSAAVPVKGVFPTPSPRLAQAAHEFEASMMKELLAPLSSTQSSLVGDQETGGSSSALTTFAGEALGKALSEHGGFGIASSILRQLTEGNRSGKPAVTASRNETATNSPFQ